MRWIPVFETSVYPDLCSILMIGIFLVKVHDDLSQSTYQGNVQSTRLSTSCSPPAEDSIEVFSEHTCTLQGLTLPLCHIHVHVHILIEGGLVQFGCYELYKTMPHPIASL